MVLVATAAPSLGCLGTNPYLHDDDVGTDTQVDTTTTTTDSDTTTTDTTDGTDTTTDTPDNCSNGMLDGDETGVDCGGSCGPCGDGEPCLVPADCQSQVCDETCQAASCDDQVLNGGELMVDCGGPCEFCQHTTLLPELDDFVSSPASKPRVTMFPDARFAVSFAGPTEPHVRWFEADGVPAGDSLVIGEGLSFQGSNRTPIGNGIADADTIEALLPALDDMSLTVDLFALRHGSDDVEVLGTRVNDINFMVNRGDIVVEGERVYVAWQVANHVLLRRWDWSVANGAWIDIDPLDAETDPIGFWGSEPALSIGEDGTVVLAWVRCDANGGYPCSVAARRFDNDWLDDAPVIATTTQEAFANPRVARGADGRSLLVWDRLDIDNQSAQARLFDADFVPQAQAWTLQTGLAATPDPDVVALSDGSFAVAWSDVDNDRVHLRRYVGPDMPKLPDLGDEAPWPNTTDPSGVAMATVEGRLVVVWSATADMVAQIQGQVLSF